MDPDQEQINDSNDIDSLIKKAQLEKLQQEIAKTKQEINDLKKNWFKKGLTFETFAKVILGLGSVFFVLSAVVAPYYAYREQKLLAAKDSIETAKNAANKLYKSKLAQVNKLSDSVNTLRQTIQSLRGNVIAIRGDYSAASRRLNDIRQDSIKRNDRKALLSSAINNYKNCLYNAFKVYIDYVRSSQGQQAAATELGIGLDKKQIRSRVTNCSNEFRDKIYTISKIKDDAELDREISLVESTVEKHFKNVFLSSASQISSSDIELSNYSLATDDTFEELQTSIKKRVKIF